MLGQHGVAGATIPRIAAHAGLTPGAVYRRFRNKDVLIETAILRILADQDKGLRLSLTVAGTANIPLASLAEQVIDSLVTSYRANAGFLRAAKLEMRTLEHLVTIFLGHGPEIGHPEPRGATALGLIMVIGTLWEIVVNPGDTKLWKGLLPTDDRTLKAELRRSFLSYLGVAT